MCNTQEGQEAERSFVGRAPCATEPMGKVPGAEQMDTSNRQECFYLVAEFVLIFCTVNFWKGEARRGKNTRCR